MTPTMMFLSGHRSQMPRTILAEDLYYPSLWEDEEENSNTKMNFARNPEEVREEMARKRQEKIARRGGGGRGGGGGQNRDVVGKARGQGQDKQVLINRARKNANKGKGQRAGADRKAAKGMF